MFTDLAFIDWIALVFAAVLLAGAVAAAVLAYATGRAQPGATPRPPAPPRPGTAAAPAPAASFAAPAHAKVESRSASVAGVPAHAKTGTPLDVDSETSSGTSASDGDEVEHVPAHAAETSSMPEPTLVHSSTVTMRRPSLVARSTPEPEVDNEAKLAARAARLRGRPLPEPAVGGRKRVVSAVTPERTPANAKSLGFDEISTPEADVDVARVRSAGFEARTPGFFDDPLGRHELRYWDGTRWTEYVKESGERFTDPL